MTPTDPYRQAVSNYARQEILNESPVELIARVFEMAALEVSRARAAIREQKWVAKARAVHQISRSLSLLQCSLNMEKGGEVAANFDRLYRYFLRRLTEVHLANDDAGFAELGRHLSELGAAWREASRKYPRTTAQARDEAPRVAAGGAP